MNTGVNTVDDWFVFDKLELGTWLVGEPGHVNCFLIEGEDG